MVVYQGLSMIIVADGNLQDHIHNVQEVYSNLTKTQVAKSDPHEDGYDDTMLVNVYKSSNPTPPVVLKDQTEQTKNDLSHEANYKLSKIEQDAMDRRYTNNVTRFSLNPSNQYEKMNSSAKRSINPMSEIKLRVSTRMLSKGFGPSLPSDALNNAKQYLSIRDILDNRDHEVIPNENEYFVRTRMQENRIPYKRDAASKQSRLVELNDQAVPAVPKTQDTLALLLDEEITRDVDDFNTDKKLTSNSNMNSAKALQIDFEVKLKNGSNTTTENPPPTDEDEESVYKRDIAFASEEKRHRENGSREHKFHPSTIGNATINKTSNGREMKNVSSKTESNQTVLKLPHKLSNEVAPDLPRFYNEGVINHAENNQRFLREANDDSVIRKKYSVVKKLLKDIDSLPVEDQLKAKDFHDDLQMQLSYLTQIQFDRVRQRRRRISRSVENLQNFTSRYSKLLRTAQSIHKTSISDQGEYDDYEVLPDYF